MYNKAKILIAGSALLATVHAYADQPLSRINTVTDSDSISQSHTLKDVQITTRRVGTSRLAGPLNAVSMRREELFKAACCNLGESFSTNPSVDVSYNDATTGARQIKLLGLSGTYVQMLTENIPNFRGAAAPYALGYVPGPWMKAIQVSKGSASVKNGYESITGQINVDYKKPEDEENIEVNLFQDTKSRMEANADANIHMNSGLSTEILLHYENSTKNHDDNNDGFLDKPKVEQYNLQNRWFYRHKNYLFHGGIGALKENRNGGQMADGHHTEHNADEPLYRIALKSNRYEAYAKNAFILDSDHGTNIALMTSASMHQLDATYGLKGYDVNEKNLYASLIFETNFTKVHNLSLGLSLNHDYLGQHYRTLTDAAYEGNIDYNAPTVSSRINDKETVPGAYAQYTLNLGHHFTAMAGIRLDHSSLYGNFITPRFHVKYTPVSAVSLRLSAGKGYRTVHALAENNYLMTSGRRLVIDPLKQEDAWNYGASAAFYIPLFGETLKLNAEYYYTRFGNQAVIDYDSNPSVIHITNLNGKSYSHTMQIDATYPLFKGMTLTAAYRLNDVKTTYGGKLMERPLTSKYKGLVTASYKTPLGLWQFDATWQLNGGGRLPAAYTDNTTQLSAWNTRSKAYSQVSAQVTRWFRHWSVYIGGENLTNFTQDTTIYGASNPWSSAFEPTMIWGPVHGRMFYAGIRVNLN